MSDDTQVGGGGRFSVAKNLKVEELLQIYDGILPDVDAALADAGVSHTLAIPGAPDELEGIVLLGVNGDPFPPEDLTAIDQVQIGKLFTFFHNWANYVTAECSRAKSHLDIQTSRNDIIRSALRVYYIKDKNIPANLADDYINTDARFVQCDADLLRLKTYYKAMESRHEQLKRTLNNISREQTRRGEELKRDIHEGGSSAPDFRR